MRVPWLVMLMMSTFYSSAQEVKPDSIVQLSLDAYNNHDFELFMSYFHEDVEMYNLNECEPYTKGKEAVGDLYEAYFEASPDLHSKILNRMVFGNTVIDYEYITGARGDATPFELIFMYEVEGDKIIRTTAIRK
ncbi:MAG: nuclear transport factor 2 family protein [bacterium]|nr:nuclear transport factor 2 family protein [bacterium]